jgi:hypothetical protein
MSDVAHFAAGILLKAELNDADEAVFVGNGAIDASDRRSLESGGNAAVEILLSGDMQLIYHRALV